MTDQQITARAKEEWDADRAYIRAIDPDYRIPPWSKATAWRRRPYLRDPDQIKADREAAQRGEVLETADE